MGLFYAIILIGALVFIHELGHFLAARLFDVKVLRFSIGFGPVIASFQKGETEYLLCALPLGGYVQMLGGDLESLENIPKEDQGRGLMMKPIWQRSIVTLAGPAANILLPILIYFLFTMTVTTTPPPIVGDVFAGGPAAAAGLQPGDKITAIDGEPIDFWFQVVEGISTRPDQKVALKVERDGKPLELTVIPERKVDTDMMGLNTSTYGLIGIHPGTYGPTIAIVDPNGTAAQAGLRSFDRVVSINNKPIQRFDEIATAVRTADGPLEFQVLQRTPIDVGYAQLYKQNVVNLTVAPSGDDKEALLGIRNAEMAVARIEPDSPAAKAGLQVGDVVVSLDGKEISNWRLMHNQISNKINTKVVAKQSEDSAAPTANDVAFEIGVIRDGQPQMISLMPVLLNMEKQGYHRMHIGWGHLSDTYVAETIPFPITKRLPFAAQASVTQTFEYGSMMIMGFVRMAQGRLSMDNVGGPILIGEMAAQAGAAGWDKFLQMMALISINLAVINLLPIPVLDGGQLMLYMLEAIKRGPLSFRTRQIASYIGISMILFLVVLAFKNDIERQWDNIASIING